MAIFVKSLTGADIRLNLKDETLIITPKGIELPDRYLRMVSNYKFIQVEDVKKVIKIKKEKESKKIQYHPIVINSEFWDNPSDKFLENGERNCIDRIKAIENELNGKEKGSLLDIGCNIGLFTFYFQKKGFNCTGIENNIHQKTKKFTDEIPTDVAERCKIIYNINPDFIVGDYLTLNRKFDYVLYLSVWHHHFFGYAHKDKSSIKTRNECIDIFNKILDNTNKIMFFEYDHKCLSSYGFGDPDEFENIVLNNRNDIKYKRIHNSVEESGKTTYTFNRIMWAIEKINVKDIDISKNYEKDITCIIKSFGRWTAVKNLVDSIRKYFKDVNILIADDSNDDNILGIKEKIIKLPYNSGLSAGRNRLLENVKSKYFLLLDDDFEFTDETRLDIFYNILEKSELDIIGGSLSNKTLNNQYKRCLKTLKIMELSEGCIEFSDDKTNFNKEFNFYYCDAIFNFFMGKTKSFRKNKIEWDEELKVGEHTIFFYNIWKNKSLKIGATNQVFAKHVHCNSTEEYNLNRNKAAELFTKRMKEYGLKKVKAISGYEFLAC